MDISEILGKKKPQRLKVPMLLDEDLRERRDLLIVAIGKAERAEAAGTGDMTSSPASLRAEYAELEEEIEAAQVVFEFQAISRDDWMRLVNTYAGGDESVNEITDDFAKHLVQEACVEPKMTMRDLDEMWASENWSMGETDKLFTGAWNVNRKVRDVPFIGAGIDGTPSTGERSDIAPLEESHDLSS